LLVNLVNLDNLAKSGKSGQLSQKRKVATFSSVDIDTPPAIKRNCWPGSWFLDLTAAGYRKKNKAGSRFVERTWIFENSIWKIRILDEGSSATF